MTAQILPGLRVPGMGRGSSLYRGVSKVSLSSCSCTCPYALQLLTFLTITMQLSLRGRPLSTHEVRTCIHMR